MDSAETFYHSVFQRDVVRGGDPKRPDTARSSKGAGSLAGSYSALIVPFVGTGRGARALTSASVGDADKKEDHLTRTRHQDQAVALHSGRISRIKLIKLLARDWETAAFRDWGCSEAPKTPPCRMRWSPSHTTKDGSQPVPRLNPLNPESDGESFTRHRHSL